jgi:methylmalonyl-CoA mutase
MTHIEEIEALGGMAKAIQAGLPKRRIEEAAARTQARIDAGRQTIVGVNRYRPSDERLPDVRQIDNTAVRNAQIAKLATLRAERDARAVAVALDDLAAGARGDGNLLALCVAAARARATVGEMSDAMERAFGRHQGTADVIAGVYGAEAGTEDAPVRRVLDLTGAFVQDAGAKPRLLVAKVGQDGHDRGQKVIASAFADLGFEVVVGPLFATPEEVAAQAIAAKVDIVGVSSLAAGHLTLIPAVKAELLRLGRPDIMLVVGGVIPPSDFAAVTAAGIDAIFPTGTVIAEAAASLLDALNARRGFAQKPPSAYRRDEA